MTDSPIRYSAIIEFDQKKVIRLTRVQFYSKTLWRDVLTVICAAALLIAGVRLGRGFVSALSLAVGAYMIISIYSRENNLSKKITARYDGVYPMIFYYFNDGGVKSSKLKEPVAFAELEMLIEDKEFLFLFRKDGSALMLEKSTVTGEGNAEALMAFISQATSLKWQSSSRLFIISIKNSIRAWRKKAEEDNFSGERLG